MELVMQVYNFVLVQGPVILGALLAIVGGLKVLAGLSPWEWDNKAVAAIDSILQKVRSILPYKENK